MDKKIVFFGTDEQSALTLKNLLEQGVDISGLVTLPERPQGRGQNIVESPARKLACSHKLPIFDYQKGELEKNLAWLKEVGPKLGILASFGAIIPQEVIDFFDHGILVVHPSLLPKYRGSSPVRQAIIDGVKKTGVTVLKMDKKMDHGPIVWQSEIDLSPQANRDEVMTHLFQLGGQLIGQHLTDYLTGKTTPQPQDHAKATYTKKFNREDGKIDWQNSDQQIEAKIRALKGWPGSWTVIGENNQEKRLKVLAAHLENNKLVLDQVQLEGKKPVSWEQFKQGHPEAAICRS